MTSNDILQLGNELSEKLYKDKFHLKNELIIYVNDNFFKKIDEDFYYRNNPEGKDFSPSFSEINIKFPNLNLKIKRDE